MTEQLLLTEDQLQQLQSYQCLNDNDRPMVYRDFDYGFKRAMVAFDPIANYVNVLVSHGVNLMDCAEFEQLDEWPTANEKTVIDIYGNHTINDLQFIRTVDFSARTKLEIIKWITEIKIMLIDNNK